MLKDNSDLDLISSNIKVQRHEKSFAKTVTSATSCTGLKIERMPVTTSISPTIFKILDIIEIVEV